jgi:hypothetical protein
MFRSLSKYGGQSGRLKPVEVKILKAVEEGVLQR